MLQYVGSVMEESTVVANDRFIVSTFRDSAWLGYSDQEKVSK